MPMTKEMQEKLQRLQAHLKTGDNPNFGRLVVDKGGNLIEDKDGSPLAEIYTEGIVKDSNDTEFTIDHLISTPRIDYVRDVMDPFGCNDLALRKNKGVFHNHAWDGPNDLPIGKNLWVTKTREGVLASTKYAVQEYAFAGDVFRLTKGGFMNSYSIGFFLKKWDLITLDDLAKLLNGKFEIPNAGDFAPDTQVWYNAEWNMYEYSAVCVPMNQDAVKKAAQKQLFQKALDEGVIVSDFGKTYFGGIIGGRPVVSVPDGAEKTNDNDKGVIVDYVAIRKELAIEGIAAGAADATKRIGELETKLQGIDAKMEQILAVVDPEEKELETQAPDKTVETVGADPVPTKKIKVSNVFDEIASGAVSRMRGKAI